MRMRIRGERGDVNCRSNSVPQSVTGRARTPRSANSQKNERETKPNEATIVIAVKKCVWSKEKQISKTGALEVEVVTDSGFAAVPRLRLHAE